jgi:hypothetical protein
MTRLSKVLPGSYRVIYILPFSKNKAQSIKYKDGIKIGTANLMTLEIFQIRITEGYSTSILYALCFIL